jgi:hypothetical protein
MYCSMSKLNPPAPLPPRGFVLQPVATSVTLLLVAVFLGFVRLQRRMEMERLQGGCGSEVDRSIA